MADYSVDDIVDSYKIWSPASEKFISRIRSISEIFQPEMEALEEEHGLI